MLIDDRIYLRDGVVLDNEDPELAEVTEALERGRLDGRDITRVLVEKGNGVTESDVPEGEVLHDGRHLTLIALPSSPPFEADFHDRRRTLIVTGDLLALTTCCLAGFAAWTNRRRAGVG